MGESTGSTTPAWGSGDPSRTRSPPAPPPGRRRSEERPVRRRDHPVEVPQRKGEPVVISQDEGVRAETTVESLGRLRPAFSKDGTITAGSSSQISDGAAAVVVMSRAKAEELGLGGSPRSARTGTWRARTTPSSRSPPTPSATPWARRG
ncbi:hypothetical protein NKH77_36120 [Streptomyces sp. M19]